jgi:hypothetical protein
MTGESKVIHALSEAQNAFQKVMRQDDSALDKGDTFEFKVHANEWKISWEKGARAIELAVDIMDRGYYTTSIELCFYTMERAFEAWVMKRKETRGFRGKHGEVFDIACDKGLISQTLLDKLMSLWKTYRADQYYRPYVPSRKSAEAMVKAAKEVMGFVEGRL